MGSTGSDAYRGVFGRPLTLGFRALSVKKSIALTGPLKVAVI
jgi:hypothetical protein